MNTRSTKIHYCNYKFWHIKCTFKERTLINSFEMVRSSKRLRTSENPEVYFNLNEMKSAIQGLRLDSLVVGDYLVVLRTNIDVTIKGEPYIALMLLLHLKSKVIFARVWNETVTVGSISSTEEFSALCKSHFGQCLGCPEYGTKENSHISFPMNRKFSKDCKKVVADDNDTSCVKCLQMVSKKGDSTEIDSVTKYKVEVISHAVEETRMVCSNEDQNYSGEYVSVDNWIASATDADDVKDVNPNDGSDQAEDWVGSDDEEELGFSENDVLDKHLDSSFKQETSEDKLKKKKHKKVPKHKSKKYEPKHAQSDKVKCPWCHARSFFKNSVMFYIHKKKNHFWGEFKCSQAQCDFVGDFAHDLTRHMGEEGHMDNTSVCCPNCKWSTQISEIEVHYKDCVMNALMVKCQVCDYRNKSRTHLNSHMIKKHFYGVFKCGGCKSTYHYAQEILDHALLNGHNEEVKCPTPSCNLKLKVEEVGPHYEKCIIKHCQIKKNAENKRKKKKIHMCDVCGKTLVGPPNVYRKHLELCTKRAERKFDETAVVEELSYCCEYCGKQFTGKNAQVHHINHKKYTHEKNLQCSICGEHFGMKNVLKRHMVRHYDPQFKCSFCGKMLKTKNQLGEHERLHTGETPFECSVCGKGFTGKPALCQHKRLVHQITGPRAKPMRRELERGITEFSVQ